MSTNFLAKPRRMYNVQPDILNFPTKNKELSQDFNFVMEMFKFFPKMQQLSFEGRRRPEEEEAKKTVAGWDLSEEWYQSLNEYTLNDSLANTVYNDAYANKDHQGDANWKFKTNEEIANKYEALGYNAWNWHTDWIFSTNHFPIGASAGEYFWGEKVGSGLGNVDFIAEGREWNHLEERTPVGGLAALFANNKTPKDKDASLDADVNRPFFINSFLTSIGSSWDEVNTMLNKYQNQSFYQLVLNSTQPDRTGASYLSMSDREKFLLVSVMVEARNRVYSISEKIFGPVSLTWDDKQMMAHFDSWMNEHNGSALSHGVNAFRILFEMQHLFLNEMAMFSATDEHRGYSAGVLDRYAFKQFSNDLGARNYQDGDFSGGKGALFRFIESMGIPLNSSVMTFLRGNLAGLTINTKPEDIALPSGLQGYGAKLQAAKWLLEQWFGANKVLAGYNNMPKSETYGPAIDFTKKDQENGYVEYNGLKVPWAISNPGAARSYGWDRVSGPYFDWRYDSRSNNFIKTNDEQYQQYSPEWASVYESLKAKYGLAYLNPNSYGDNYNHRNYTRMLIGGLDTQEIAGRSGNLAPYSNSWAVYELGNMIRYGEIKDKARMNVYNFMESAEKFRYKRAQEKFEEEKERINDEESQDEKNLNKIKSSYKQSQKFGETMVKKGEIARKQAQSQLEQRSEAQRAEKARSDRKAAAQGPKKAAKKA
ncbi:MAG: hypothetical protein WC500_06790 [Candidatus Margulisiibacteriota bacterium]